MHMHVLSMPGLVWNASFLKLSLLNNNDFDGLAAGAVNLAIPRACCAHATLQLHFKDLTPCRLLDNTRSSSYIPPVA